MDTPSIFEEFQEKGLVVLRNVFTDKQIDRYNQTVSKVREIFDTNDTSGRPDRIGQLHQRHPSLLELAFEEKITSLLAEVFASKPVVFGSLNFEVGTQQALHVDAVFFYPQPEFCMAGVWIALDDVDETNGPLMYIPGSHKWEMLHSVDIVEDHPEGKRLRDRVRSGSASPEERAETLGILGNIWAEKFSASVAASSQPVRTVPVKKGDVVIWHSLLAHGGSPVKDLTKTRKSAVFHFLAKESSLFSFDAFMFFNPGEFTDEYSERIQLDNYGSNEYIKYPHFVLYEKGQEKVMPL